MTEAAANSTTPGSFDLEQARAALTSSSTKARIAQLRGVDEKISHKGECGCMPGCGLGLGKGRRRSGRRREERGPG